jgi:predicted HTH transcriptional regulator
VEVWGRGTNRVISACKKHGAKPPVFEENEGFVYVTFKAQIVATDETTEQVELEDQGGSKSGPSRTAQALP